MELRKSTIRSFGFNNKSTLVAYTFSILVWIFFDINSSNFKAKVIFYLLLQSAAILLAYQLLVRNFVVRLILAPISVLILFTIPMIGIIYYLNFNKFLGLYEFNALFQTNGWESIGFIRDFIRPKWIILFASSSVLYCLYLIFKVPKVSLVRKNISIGMLLFIPYTSLTLFSKGMQPEAYRNLRIYMSELSQWRKVSKERKVKSNLIARKRGQGEVHVLIMGESLNRNNMGLYGYFRDTNPLLNGRNDLYIFSDVVSSKTATNPSITDALTNSRSLNPVPFSELTSAIEYLNAAKIETVWLSNQIKYGLWDNHVSVLADSSDKVIFSNGSVGQNADSTAFDDYLLDILDNVLGKRNQEQNTFYFIHLMGSHGPYCARFPKEYGKFKSDNGLQNYFGDAVREYDEINCYDSSIYFNDYVVNAIIERIKKLNTVSSIIYTSDHGENVLEGHGHNASEFRFDMMEIPFLIWLSDSYKSTYADKVVSIQSAQEKPFMLDDLFHVIFDLFDIETDAFNPGLSLVNKDYVTPEERKVYGHNYDSLENRKNLFKRNFEELSRQFSGKRFIIHRVDNIGVLNEMLLRGIENIEVDVYYNKNKDTFDVGHHEGAMSGLSLENLLEHAEKRGVKSLYVWLDFKNFHNKEASLIKERIEKLKKRFQFFKGLMFESSSKDNLLGSLRPLVDQLTFYLPTDEIKQCMKECTEAQKSEMAELLKKAIEKNGCQSISFEAKLYPFIKNYLEKKISENIAYHMWDLSLSFEQKNLLNSITLTTYIRDPRVKNIILTHNSPYSL